LTVDNRTDDKRFTTHLALSSRHKEITVTGKEATEKDNGKTSTR